MTEQANSAAEAAQGWTSFVAASLDQHVARGLSARDRVTSGGYDLAAWQGDLAEFTSQVMKDATQSMALLAEVARSFGGSTESTDPSDTGA